MLGFKRQPSRECRHPVNVPKPSLAHTHILSKGLVVFKNALPVIKFVASGIVGFGTSKIVKSIIENNVIKPNNNFSKVAVAVATSAISGLVVTATKNHMNEMVDELADKIEILVVSVKVSDKIIKLNAGKTTIENESLLDPDFLKKDASGVWTVTEAYGKKLKAKADLVAEQDILDKLSRINLGESSFKQEKLNINDDRIRWNAGDKVWYLKPSIKS
jgi:hypothetical protein